MISASPLVRSEDAFGRLLDSFRRGAEMVAMMEAYFDETGTHTGPLKSRPILMCVAGNLFTAERAKRLHDKWDSALRQAGLGYFRMSECASGHGQFEGWPEAHRARFAKKMAALVRDYRTRSVGVWTRVSEFDHLAPPGWRRYYGGAYTACLMQCLVMIAVWARETKYEGDIAYFFESGDSHAKEANVHMNNVAKSERHAAVIHYGGHSFLPKGKARPLEAADLLAWHLNRSYNGLMRHGSGTIDDHMTPLFRFLHDGHEASFLVYALIGQQLRDWFASQPPPPAPPPPGKGRPTGQD